MGADAPVWLDILVGPNRLARISPRDLRLFLQFLHCPRRQTNGSQRGHRRDLASFADLSELESLFLDGTRVTDAGSDASIT